MPRPDPYAPPLHRLHAVLERNASLDEGDVADPQYDEYRRDADRRGEERLEAVGRALEPMTQPRRWIPPEEEIAAMVLALTYGEMIALVAAINAVADGKLDGIDLAPILYAWGHKTRAAA